MLYDYQLVGGALATIISLVGIANAMIERRSLVFGVLGFLMGAGLLGWAWVLSEGALTPQDLPEAVYRLIAAWK